MDKKKMKLVEEKFDQFHRFDKNRKEPLDFLLKALLVKFLDNNKQLDFLTKQACLQVEFSFEKIFEIWNQGVVEGFGGEKCEPIDELSWQWLIAFVKEAPLLKGENTAIIGVIYEKRLIAYNKKKQGAFYTPKAIADFMVAQWDREISCDLKILDPACGSGMLLSATYDYIFNDLCKDASDEKKRRVHRQLLEKTLIGIDLDEIACLVTRLVLILKGDFFVYPLGIHNCDILKSDPVAKGSVDVIMANPPYVGHKEINKTYMENLKKKYSEIYLDKGDLSYCFVYRSWELLKNKGRLIYLTSRYFLEAHFAGALRQFISECFEIQEVIDFNGNRVIEGVGVDPAILKLKKMAQVAHSHRILVKRFKMPGNHDLKAAELVTTLSLRKSKSYDSYFVDQKLIKKEPWRLYKPITRDIIEKIESKSPLFLSQVGESFQGMITGRDKAFIFDQLPFEVKDQAVLKPWLKNKDVRANSVNKASKTLVYTDAISAIEKESDLCDYLLNHQEKLKNRRECRLGKRPWYFLQWGRSLSYFERKKIIFPYKAAVNRFAVDDEGSCFSADIYGMVLKNQETHNYTEEILAFILNSRLYNYYFKSFAKKLGHNLYEYYPNTVLKLKIPLFKQEEINTIKDYYGILKSNSNGNSGLEKKEENQINHYLYDYFDLNIIERDEIEKMG